MRAGSSSGLRQLVFALLLTVAVLGFLGLLGLSLLRGVSIPLWVWMVCPSLGLGVPILLCGWCAIYVRDEPARVRIALIWIGFLFLALALAVLLSGNVH